jgi:hypothetical protein
MQIRRAQPSEVVQLKTWIAARHYLHCCPPGAVCLYEFADGARVIGGMLIGRPCAKSYDADRILQLHRMFFVDETDPFVESQALKQMRKHIRVWFPQIRGVLSYSDPSQGHQGTVYDADNWCPLGFTREPSGLGWNSRNGRMFAPKTSKMRWFRTP